MRIKSLFYSVLVVGLGLALLNSCKTKDAKEAVSQEDNELKNLEEKAKGAIARAESAGAAELSPELLDSAYIDLRNGQEKDPKSDGGAQREQYLSAIDKADQAYDDTISKSRTYWLTTVRNYERDLDELDGPLYIPEYDGRSRELLSELRSKIEEGDNEASFSLYQSTIPNIDSVVDTLAANVDWLDQLRQEVTGLLGEASRQDLRGESARLERQGRSSYDSAMGHRSRGDMQSMEQDLFDARYYLGEALRLSGALNIDRIDGLMLKMKERLETASRRRIVDSDGNELEVRPWSGDNYLDENPLLPADSIVQTGERRRDKSELKEPSVSADFFGREVGLLKSDALLTEKKADSRKKPQSFQADWQLYPIMQSVDSEIDTLDSINSREGDPFEGQDGRTNPSSVRESLLESEVPQISETPDSVRNRISESEDGEDVLPRPAPAPRAEAYVADDASQAGERDLLSDAELLMQQAIQSWENGVQSRNDGDLPRALHYFEESERLVDEYNVQYAILGYYTVRTLTPEDCLWRIAGYSDIYGDPFQWTRIYQRNKDIINNPSLIYPGQRFIIPPAKD